MGLVNRKNAPNYVWGQECEGWRLLDDDGLSVIEERMPPGTAEQRHIHHKANQLFYVLEGQLVMEYAGTRYQLAAGDSINITPGLPHQAHNDSTEPVRFLVISAPTTRGDRVEVD